MLPAPSIAKGGSAKPCSTKPGSAEPSSAVRKLALLLAATLVLVGCEGSVTVDLGTNDPADPAVDQVLVDLEGVEFTSDSGSTEALRFDDPVRVDLAEYGDANLFRLFTDEQLPDGRYTSVRLLFEDDSDDENDFVIVESGGQFDLTVNATATSSVDFTVDKDDASRENIVLTIDLRQSLSFDDDSDDFTLVPVVRAVRAEDTGRIIGNVTASCPAGRTLAQGGAVYLFEGEDVDPDDRDGADAEPYLTAKVGGDFSNTSTAYSFSYVPEGDYTLALTCRGHLEDASTNDDLDFQNVSNVQVEAEETLTRNIGS
jgi:hypothetical protein